ncbi:uncharacterized protein LOC132720493, partial [Ruditapes philippinarum]|uniref:uncharacterized protein LOC132720493 n=1 Tax=Ruditapes philippinarum TaxID=129788 RepID=UPI00295B4B87
DANNEYNVQVILAAHLFGPLAGGYKIGNKGFPKDARRCPNCGKDISGKLKSHGDVWHGHADILVKGSVVKVVSEENDSDEEDGSSEPLQKKMRTESIEDDESSESGENYDSSVEKGEKKNGISDHALSQILAQTIVNAFAEVNNNQKLFSSFIPSLIATSKVIRITMYNCKLDSLIMTDDLISSK